MTNEVNEHEQFALLCIQRALDDSWQDGKRRIRLKQVMEGRMRRLRERGFMDLVDARRRDRELYDRFLDGCIRALRRDGLIEAGLLSQDELRRLKERALVREHDAAFDDVATDWYEPKGAA